MRPLLALAGLALGSALLINVGSAAEDEFGPGWPEGETAEEVGYFCMACHSLSIVRQQGLDRKTWDDVLEWMVDEHGMAELDEETKARFLDFLAESFGPERGVKERLQRGS